MITDRIVKINKRTNQRYNDQSECREMVHRDELGMFCVALLFHKKSPQSAGISGDLSTCVSFFSFAQRPRIRLPARIMAKTPDSRKGSALSLVKPSCRNLD